MEEIEQNKIEEVVAVLKSKEFYSSLEKVSDLSKIAEQLIKQNPGLTPEQIGDLYEQQLAEKEEKQEGPSLED